MSGLLQFPAKSFVCRTRLSISPFATGPVRLWELLARMPLRSIDNVELHLECRAMLNRELTRAARALLGLTQAEVAQRAAVAVKTIADFERGATVPQDRTLRDIQRAFEDAGIEFLFDGARGLGLRWRK